MYGLSFKTNITTNQGSGVNSNLGDGTEDDELIGLEITEMKRLRGSPEM